MASSVSCGYAFLQDGGTYDGLLTRVNLIAAMFLQSQQAVNPGVLPSGNGMQVTAGAGMTVQVATGAVVCPAGGSDQGAYSFALLDPATLTVETSDPTNPRIDMVVANVVDPGTSAGEAEVQIIAGTPTAGATLANLAGASFGPGNQVILAYVLVPAGSVSVAGGNIDNVQVYTVAQGGVLVVDTASSFTFADGYEGMLVYDLATSRFWHNPPGGVLEQAAVLPFTPQFAAKTTNTNVNAGATVTLLSATVTTNGSTDIEIRFKWAGIEQGTNTDSQLEFQLWIDGTQVDGVYVGTGIAPSIIYQGGSVTYPTNGDLGTTPADGTHTVEVKAVNSSGGGNVITVVASVARPLYLYVKPVCL